jgi:hypothetical protein
VLVDVHSGEFGDWDVQVLRLGNGAVSGRMRWTMKAKSESVGRCVSRGAIVPPELEFGMGKVIPLRDVVRGLKSKGVIEVFYMITVRSRSTSVNPKTDSSVEDDVFSFRHAEGKCLASDVARDGEMKRPRQN